MGGGGVGFGISLMAAKSLYLPIRVLLWMVAERSNLISSLLFGRMLRSSDSTF